jgi:starch phosphorylase
MPALPEPLLGLREIAYNLWWSFTPEAQALFETLDPQAWKRSRHNPVRVLLDARPQRLQELANNAEYVGQLGAVLERLHTYMAHRPGPGFRPTIGYFSMEFGFHESLPIYSGGLGILAGDHVKAASDLALNLNAVGLFYHEGYFVQELSSEGVQKELYDDLRPEELPIERVLDSAGNPLKVSLEFPGRTVFVTVLKVQVGRVPVYLMSTKLPENSAEDQGLTARLYAPGQEMRIKQEVVLGIGGVRILRALGLAPDVWHMNEGHAAFMGLERIREFVVAGKPYAEALEAAAAGALFTTHTPVPAGHDSFALELIDRYLDGWWTKLGIGREDFIRLGQEDKSWGAVFSMSNLALTVSRAAGGVSELHGEVSRGMFQGRWQGLEAEEVPIGSITNGVHTATFLSPLLAGLYDRAFPQGWAGATHKAESWTPEHISDSELWAARNTLRQRLVEETRARLFEQRQRNGEVAAQQQAALEALDPHVLTIGFARRFATYKRAVLLLSEPERLKGIIGQGRVQFIFAGKAHPKDDPGKAFIQQLHTRIREAGLEGQIILLENYDMNLARFLVQGVDVWLNTPRRPLEASGTSGMKAGLNGGLNFSILDGWWAEGYNGKNGFAIGDGHELGSEEAQDRADVQNLYNTLEGQVIPLFYNRNAGGLPEGWLAFMRESIRTVGPEFAAARMVDDYRRKFYEPLAQRGQRLTQGETLHGLTRWKSQTRQVWDGVRLWVEQPAQPNGKLQLKAFVQPAGIPEEFLRVELVVRRSSGELEVLPLSSQGRERDAVVYSVAYVPGRAGSYEYGVRVVATHPELSNPYEGGFVRWAESRPGVAQQMVGAV